MMKQNKDGEKNGTNHGNESGGSAGKPTKKKANKPMASMSETLSFAFQCGPRVTWIFVLGCIGAFCTSRKTEGA